MKKVKYLPFVIDVDDWNDNSRVHYDFLVAGIIIDF